MASGLSANVSKLHEYLYGEKNYEPTENVKTVDSAVTAKPGISEFSSGYNPTESVNKAKTQEETTVDTTDYDYDDGGKSDLY